MTSKIVAMLLTITGMNAWAVVPHESGGFIAPVAIEIRYVSIGTGIDSEFKKQVNSLLVFRKISNQISYIKESNWGHEGESTVCIQFKTFSEANATLTEILELKKSVSSKYTLVESVGSCETQAENNPL